MDGGKASDLLCVHGMFADSCLCCKMERVMAKIKADPWIKVKPLSTESYGGK